MLAPLLYEVSQHKGVLVPGWVTISLHIPIVECIILQEPSSGGHSHKVEKLNLLGLGMSQMFQMCATCRKLI